MTHVSVIHDRLLNISNPTAYLEAYCLNPPIDSCAFGYCSNPDVASLLFGYPVLSLYHDDVSAILVLYSPEDVPAQYFFSQLLNVYSLIIAAIIAIAHRNLTKPHTARLLIIYVIGALLGTKIDSAQSLGKKWLNRFAVLTLVPSGCRSRFSALPKGMWHFQQSACDEVITGDRVIPTLCGMFIITWATCIYPQRGRFGETKQETSVVADLVSVLDHILIQDLMDLKEESLESYPDTHSALFWFLNIEIGRLILLPRETFTSTYGQVTVALLVTVPPLIQICLLLPKLLHWFIDLTWVRLLTCRRNKPFARRRQERTESEFTLRVTSSSKPTLDDCSRSEESVQLQSMLSSDEDS
ncbi:hypothetical protein B0H13DRAFT_2023074, partial [Mycena leptocephala]